jgi:hypothetical protein
MAFDPSTATAVDGGKFDPSSAKPGPAPTPLKIGVEGLPDAVKAVAGDFHPLTQAAVGGKALWDMAAMKLKQGLGLNLSPEEQTTIAANRALLENSTPALAGAMATGVGAGALAAPFAGFAAARFAPALPGMLQPAVPAAVTGMVLNAATNPTLPGESGDKAINQGGLAAVAADTLLRGGARVVQPITQSPAVQNLLQRNVVPTIGQSAGGMANRIEEKLSSVPVVGDIISSARNRARNELGVAGINEGLPADLRVNQPGNAGVEQAKTNLSDAYKNLYGNTRIGADAQLTQDLNAAVNKPTIPLSDDYRKVYDKIVKSEITDRLTPGATFPTGEVKAQIEASLGKKIRDLGPMPSGQDLALKQSLEEARNAVRDLANRGAGVDQSRRAALDRGWANMKDMKTAAGWSEANGGIPTPLQIINAAKEGTPLEQLGRSAQEVLGNKVPNSGTTDRLLMSLLLGAGGAAASHEQVPYLSSIDPKFWLALGASPLLYSRAGSRYMAGDLIPGQPALADALRQMAPYAARAGALYQQ